MQEIPGYHRDPETGKYYKIVKGHAATPSQAKHTQGAVEKSKRHAAAKEQHRVRAIQQKKQTVVERQRLLSSGGLEREIGARKSSYFMRSIWPDACASTLRSEPRLVTRPPKASIRLFDQDPDTRTIYAVEGENTIKRRKFISSTLDSSDSAHHRCYEWDSLASLTSEISSLIYLPLSGALAATSYGSDRPPVVCLTDPERDGAYVNQQFTIPSCRTIWGAAARPISFSYPTTSTSIPGADTECLAVGAAKNLVLFSRPPSGEWISNTALHTDSDILSSDWLSPTVVALGRRNGTIKLYDTRSKGSSTVCRLSFPVLRLKRADDPTRLVCVGANEDIVSCDIRFGTESPVTNIFHQIGRVSAPSTYHIPLGNLKKVTNNGNVSQLHIDTNAQLSLLAASLVSDDGTPVIRVYNMWTGAMVKEVVPKHIQHSISFVKFVGTEIWAVWNGGIVQIGYS